MFDIGWGELLLIGVVALIAIGPKELPGVLRAIGQWSGKIRRMASEFQGQFQEAMREAEMADLKKQIDETTSQLSSNFDPLGYDSSTWKPSTETSTNTVANAAPAADAPPVPPAEAIAPAPAEPAPEVSVPPEPAPAVTEKDIAPSPEPRPSAPDGGRQA